MRSKARFHLIVALAVTSCTPGGKTGPGPAEPGARTAIAPEGDPYEGTAPPDQREKPPPPGLTPEWSFPTQHHAKLDNGLPVRVVERHSVPVVDIKLVVLTGSSADADKPGLAVVAGELLKAGGAGNWTSRELLDRAESLGSGIEVLTDRDSTRISMAVTRDHFATALDIIATVATRPRLDAGEFTKLKRREMDRVSSLSRTSAHWAANMVLYRELYELPAGVHPYSRYDATAAQIGALDLEDCRKWHGRHITPENAFLVVAGDVTNSEVEEAAKRSFASWKGGAPEAVAFTEPRLADTQEVFLVDRPGSPQAEVYVATLGPERTSDSWAALRATNQVLGGGVAGRLFLDVREKRSLAYRTNSSLEEVAHGPVPIVLTAGTQTAKAGLAVGALLEHFQGIYKTPPTEAETQIATRYLSDVFLLSVDTVGAVSSLVTRLGVFGLPDDYYDQYRARVRSLTPPALRTVADRYFHDHGMVIVVAGDAKRLSRPLSHYGQVTIVDPDKGFVTSSKVPFDPTAPIELERASGT